MKKNRLLIGALAITGAFMLGSCGTSRQIYGDDVYGSRGQARQKVYQSPDYYYTDADGDQQGTRAQGGYYDDEYSDQDYNTDSYQDLEYANRINRFYYASPGMTYFDPFFDPWYGYGMGGWYGYGPSFGLGWGWNSGWGSSWSMGFGMGWGSSWGWGSPWYGGYHPWGGGWYGGGYWGSGWYGNGYWGGGYYGNVIPRYASARSSYRDNYNVRTSSARTRTAGGYDRTGVARDSRGRITSVANGRSRTSDGSIARSRGSYDRSSGRSRTSDGISNRGYSDGARTRTSDRYNSSYPSMRSSSGNAGRTRTSSGDISRPMSRSMESRTRSSNPGSTSRPYTPPTRSYDGGSSRSSGSSMGGGGFSRGSSGGGGGGSTRSSGGRTR